jgi:hypothetical protein
MMVKTKEGIHLPPPFFVMNDPVVPVDVECVMMMLIMIQTKKRKSLYSYDDNHHKQKLSIQKSRLHQQQSHVPLPADPMAHK